MEVGIYIQYFIVSGTFRIGYVVKHKLETKKDHFGRSNSYAYISH